MEPNSSKVFKSSSKARFFVMCGVIFLVGAQGKFEIDHSCE